MMRMMQMSQMMQMMQAQAGAGQMGGAGAAAQTPAQEMSPEEAYKMGQMEAAKMAAMMGGRGKKAAAMQAAAAMQMQASADPSASSFASAPADDEQASAMQAAVNATQEAIYMQQLQFQQQVRADANKQQASKSTKSRFRDDYRAYKFCSHFQAGMCWQGQVCVYAHSFAELHPASPDMPDNVETPSTAMAEAAPERDKAPVMRLRKKRDLCRKFTDTGHCSRAGACPNAHGEAEIGKTAFVLYDKVKLEECNAWKAGRCSYGNKCIYAHGDHEIGQKRREWDAPPIKKRKASQTEDEWKEEILRDPYAAPF